MSSRTSAVPGRPISIMASRRPFSERSASWDSRPLRKRVTKSAGETGGVIDTVVGARAARDHQDVIESKRRCHGGPPYRGCGIKTARRLLSPCETASMVTPDGYQFHFDPASYLETIRAEVPAYDELQDAVAEATVGIQTGRVSSSAS
jgi:hypothetical protein